MIMDDTYDDHDDANDIADNIADDITDNISNELSSKLTNCIPADVMNKLYHSISRGRLFELKEVIRNSMCSGVQLKKMLETAYHCPPHSSLSPTFMECAPALLIASKYGHLKIVHYLIKEYNVNVDGQGTVHFDGFLIEGATALWCASGKGHLDIVQALVENHASVNLTTNSNSTPLRAACFDGHIEVVKYLVGRGADVNIPNRYLNNCLMISAYRGHLPVVEFLLEQGMDPNVKANSNATALLFAAETDREDICRVLVQSGAQLSNNDLGLDQVFVAAENARSRAVYYLISEPRLNVSRVKIVEALELLGAMLLNDKERYDPTAAFRPLKQAMEIRCGNPPLPKQYIAPCAAYGNVCEVTTVAELQDIQYDFEALSLQGLMARERILGRKYKDLPVPIVYRGAVYADQSQFGRCLDLWMHALELKIEQFVSCGKDLLRLAQVLSQMLTQQIQPPLSIVTRILELSTEEMSREFQRLQDSRIAGKNFTNMKDECINGLHTCLYLLVILCKIKMTGDQDVEVCTLVHRLVQKGFTVPTQRKTLLHLSCDYNTQVDSFHINQIVKFPSPSVVYLLLICGADPNARDAKGDTPLHTLCRHNTTMTSYVIYIQSILAALLRHGAHHDLRNASGQTPKDVALSNVVPLLLQKALDAAGSESLKCRAALAVIDHKLPTDFLPTVVQKFVSMHEFTRSRPATHILDELLQN